MNISNKLLPQPITNEFPGPKFVLYFFYLITAITVWRSIHHLTAPDGGAQSIATIPLDSYPPAAAATIIGIFSLWGLSQLLLGFIYVICAVRYRSLIPLFFAMMVAEYLGRMIIGNLREIETAGTAPGGVANLYMVVLASVLLAFCLKGKKKDIAPPPRKTRGRPPKNKSEDIAPPPRKTRGRPPKNKSEDIAPPPRKTRGRPPKNKK